MALRRVTDGASDGRLLRLGRLVDLRPLESNPLLAWLREWDALRRPGIAA